MNRRFSRHGNFNISFIDMLLAFVGVLAIMVMMAFALMAIKKTYDEGVLRKADYIATVTWDDAIDCDVDLWIRDGDGKISSFKNRQAGQMALERDDLGFSGDTTQTITSMLSNMISSGKNVPIKPDQYNEETIVFRGTTEGVYNVSVFLYSCRAIENQQILRIKKGDLIPFELKIDFKLMKVNPYKIMVEKTVKFERVAEEVPIVEFDMDSKKNASRFSDTAIKIVKLDEGIIP